MNQMKKLLTVLFLFLITASTIFSQVPPAGARPGGPGAGMNAVLKNGKISGKVIDTETQTPMEYANISIFRKQDSKLITGSISNASGAFVITDLPLGEYYVEASFIGLKKQR